MLKCGEGGIRTPDAGITDVTVFETAAFNRSATSPLLSVSTNPPPFNYPLLPILLHFFGCLNLGLQVEENDDRPGHHAGPAMLLLLREGKNTCIWALSLS